MKAPHPRDPAWIVILDRIYAAALHLYPHAHRQRWGTAMRQVFRDRCRETQRTGRGAWRIVLGECLPDLAFSASRERADAFQELSPMRRMLAIVLMLTALAAGIFHARLGDGVLAAKDAWNAYQTELDSRALHAHEATLATQVAQRDGAHADVVAAQLYFAAADGFRRRYPAASNLHLSTAQAQASDALLNHADAAFTHALRSEDRWALWLAAMDACPARAKVCDATTARARLRMVDADNGAVWAMDLYRAQYAHDAVGERAALARLAGSTRFDWHYRDAVSGMLSAFALQPLPSRLRQSFADGSAATVTDSASLLAFGIGSAQGSMQMPPMQPLITLCKTPDPAIRSDCRAAAQVIAERSYTITDRMIGLSLWRRVADAGEQVRVEQMYRDARWQSDHLSEVVPELSPSAVQRWLAQWKAQPGEVQMMQRLLESRGIALQAPATYALNTQTDR